jgi:hypothetical protein
MTRPSAGYFNAAGQKIAAFECWPEKLNKLQVGERYAVETREGQGAPDAQDREGPAVRRPQPAVGKRTREPDLKKTSSSPEPVSENSSVKAEFSTAERAYVASIVSAFIAAGTVDRA